MTAYPSWTPAPRAGIVPLHPLTFGTILGRSFTALRRNPKVLLGFALGMQMLAYIVLLLVVGGVAFASFSRLDTVPYGSDEYEALTAGSVVITAVTGVVLGIAATALTIIVQGVVIADVAHGVISERLTVGALWRRVRPAFWRLMGWTFLSVVIVAAVVAVLVVAIVGLGALEPVAGVVAAILLVLAAIPVVFFFTTKLFLVPEVLVLEGAGVFSAIGRSWRLTRGRFWKTLGIWFLIQLTFGIIAQVVSIPFSLLSGLLSSVIAPTGAAEPSAVIGLLATAGLTQIVTLLIQSVALVVGASAGTLVYVDARMRTEGLDHDLQSYVEQRQAGAGLADPYRWHIGRQIAPAPSYAPPGYSPAAAQQGYPQTGYPQGYPQPGYPPQGSPQGSPQPQPGRPQPGQPQGYPTQVPQPGYPPQAPAGDAAPTSPPAPSTDAAPAPPSAPSTDAAPAPSSGPTPAETPTRSTTHWAAPGGSDPAR